MDYLLAKPSDGYALAELRALTMEPSLTAIGRYDANTVRNRFLDTFEPSQTVKIMEHGTLVGFYVVRIRADHHYLDHLYIQPEHQNRGLGKAVIDRVVNTAQHCALPVRLGALRESRSNQFYLNNGFVKTHEDEFDIYYEYSTV